MPKGREDFNKQDEQRNRKPKKVVERKHIIIKK